MSETVRGAGDRTAVDPLTPRMRAALEDVVASAELEGVAVPDEVIALAERFGAGEIDRETYDRLAHEQAIRGLHP